MRGRILISLLFASLVVSTLPAAEEDSWTYWVSGGKRGIGPRMITDEQFVVGSSDDYFKDRAVGFKEDGGIEILRIGKDIEEPEFADPELAEIGAVGEKKVWKAEYGPGEERTRKKAIMLLLSDDDGQLHPFFFIAPGKGENLSVKVQPNAEETERVIIALTRSKAQAHTFAFKFPKGKPQLIKANKS